MEPILDSDSPKEGLPRPSKELQAPYFLLSATTLRKPEYPQADRTFGTYVR